MQSSSDERLSSVAGRTFALVYGVISYLFFLASLLYAMGFVGNVLVPKSIDSGAADGAGVGTAVLVNVILLGIFAVQHSVMARQEFKRIWTKLVPRPIERSTYVLISSLLLFLLYWLWVPIPAAVWDVSGTSLGTLLWVMYWIGWGLVLASSFFIDHFELFGLRQVYAQFQQVEFDPPDFQAPYLYKYVRHPLMLGFFIAFWATPRMSTGHMIFSIATSGYIVIGTLLEERDMIRRFGDRYKRYRKAVGMFFPLPSNQPVDESLEADREDN